MKETSLPKNRCRTFLKSVVAVKRKLARTVLAGLAVAAAVSTSSSGQGLSPYVFGINYTQRNLDATKVNDLKSANLTIIRLGGNERNNSSRFRDKTYWNTDIEYVKYTLDAEPIIQLPIALTAAQAAEWVTYFNVTKGYNIKFWSIGNEPEPGGNPQDDFIQNWINGTNFNQAPDNNFDYNGWEARWITIANAIKNTDNDAKVFGPEFRCFYPGAISREYAKFITNVGSRSVTNNSALPLLDIFAFHYYPTSFKTESELKRSFDSVQSKINAANNSRPSSWSRLRMGVTEFNGEKTGNLLPWDFSAGQFVSLMTKLAIANDAFCLTPWSVYESGGQKAGFSDFSFYNTAGTRRSTMHHYAFLSQNMRANYMPPTQSGYADEIMALGMRESGTANAGYTIMLMNRNANSLTYNISLTGNYQGTTTSDVQIKFSGYSGVSGTALTGTIPTKTTIMYRLNSSGGLVSKKTYDQTDASPARPALASAPDIAATSEVLAVYPNPVTGSFLLNGLVEPGDITVRNSLGKVLLRQHVKANERVDISRLPAGLYLLTIGTTQGEVVQKIVKE
ncbi:T9SS type A sorting domain-containing protein [Hymenobacter negativus]|uniref:T9SS type A sorting domain-containing protein n=1 Tax=Hymenobacter negativus TaxID=2795026 RepID=A0ABS3QM92_9BACT|nr:T9SS type A sorting domain-containing protein [Hymenobacter negativus]MBO2011889.1 T9SS type A sorting domain-containing protein [Hymenobacter negativus]